MSSVSIGSIEYTGDNEGCKSEKQEVIAEKIHVLRDIFEFDHFDLSRDQVERWFVVIEGRGVIHE